MSSEEAPLLFSWQRLRSTDELGDFVSRHLATLDHVSLED